MTHEHWTSYWQTGVTGSFGAQEPKWYKEILEPFWQDIFSSLPQKAEILDVATGNGAIARIAALSSKNNDREFSITASDKARQKPAETNYDNGIKYLLNSPTENLEFPGHQFDLITSQFGIEYSDIKKSLPTLFKHLKPGAELIFIAHNSQSIICNESREELNQYRSILDEQPIFKKLDQLITSMGEIRSRSDLAALKSNRSADKSREAFNRLVAKLTARYSEGIVIADLLKQINPIFKQMMMAPVSEKLKFSNTIKLNMQQARLRLQDMVSAALDEKGVKQLLLLAENTGFECSEASKLEDDSTHLLAWKIRLKSAG
ncbi:MAG: class I SAM-dependent methyltransferase [Bacteroidota bacterium]